MSDLGFHLFATAIGDCGIVWNSRGIVGVQLPEKSERLTRARVARRFPAARETAPPPDITRAIGDIVALLAGEHGVRLAPRVDSDEDPVSSLRRAPDRVCVERRRPAPGRRRVVAQSPGAGLAR